MEKLPKGGLIGRTIEAYLWVREKQISLHAAYAGYFIILAVFPALLMLLSLLPAGVLAAEGDVSVTLSGMHDAQVKSLKLYTYMDGVKGADDLLAETQATDSKYTVELAPGAYWVDGYDANGDCNGGVSINVSSDSSTSTR